jgi:hypothetical protein
VKPKKKGYNSAKYLKVLEQTPEEYSFLSVDSKVFNLKNKYPIFLLNHSNKEGTWNKFQDKLAELDQSVLEDIKEEEVIKFLDENLDVYFELELFDDLFPDPYYFKIKNQIYCYSILEMSGNYSTVRFFFDIKKFIE